MSNSWFIVNKLLPRPTPHSTIESKIIFSLAKFSKIKFQKTTLEMLRQKKYDKFHQLQ